MQAVSVQPNAQPVRFRDTLGGDMNAAIGGMTNGADVFMALLMQMMGGGEDGGDMNALFGQQMGQAQSDEDRQDYTLASQMMAETLFQNPAAMQAIMQAADGNPEMMVQAVNNLGVQNLFGQEAAPTAKDPKAQALQFLSNLSEKAQQQGEGGQEEIQVLSTPNSEDSQAQDGMMNFGGESSFKNAVLEAQKLLKANRQNTRDEEKVPLDVDRLQGEVNAGKYTPAAAVKGKAALPQPQALAEQVKTGILQNMGKGKDEFVVKLKPDGLGEITVKMVEESGRISMSIVASNNQVAKMLSGELAGLRESLRPYQADVREVVSQSEASYQAAQDNQNFNGQQHQQFQQGHQGHQEYYYYDGEDSSFTPEAAQETLADGLDTYI